MESQTYILQFHAWEDYERLKDIKWDWFLNDIVLDRQWLPDHDAFEDSILSIPQQMLVEDILDPLWYEESIGHLCSALGNPLTIGVELRNEHSILRACIAIGSSFNYPMNMEIKIEGTRRVSILKVSYVNCKPYCSICKGYGHWNSGCSKYQRSIKVKSRNNHTMSTARSKRNYWKRWGL